MNYLQIAGGAFLLLAVIAALWGMGFGLSENRKDYLEITAVALVTLAIIAAIVGTFAGGIVLIHEGIST